MPLCVCARGIKRRLAPWRENKQTLICLVIAVNCCFCISSKPAVSQSGPRLLLDIAIAAVCVAVTVNITSSCWNKMHRDERNTHKRSTCKKDKKTHKVRTKRKWKWQLCELDWVPSELKPAIWVKCRNSSVHISRIVDLELNAWPIKTVRSCNYCHFRNKMSHLWFGMKSLVPYWR